MNGGDRTDHEARVVPRPSDPCSPTRTSLKEGWRDSHPPRARVRAWSDGSLTARERLRSIHSNAASPLPTSEGP
jgi:hypothetical protein